MIGQSRQRPWVWLLTLAVLVSGGPALFAQQPGTLRLTRNIPGDSKPIVLYADDIATWSEGGQRIFVLKGKVFIEHGIVNARCQQAVVWVDENRFRLTHIYHADVYTEGEVQLENGPDTKSGPKALLDLNTRGELKIKSQSKKVAEKPQSNDPLVLRAQAERSPQAGKPATPPSPIQRTSMQQVIPAAAPAPAPGATTPTPVPPLVPPTTGPTPPSLLPPLPSPTPPAPVPAPTGAPPVSSQPMTPPAPPSPNPPATPPPPSSSSLQPGPPFAPPTPVPRPPDDPAAKPPGPQAGGNSGPPRILSIAP